MRFIWAVTLAGIFFAGERAAAQELISKDDIKNTILGPTRAIGKKQRTAVNLPTITFEFNSASLTPQGRQQLDLLAEAIKEVGLTQQTFTIEGYTDAAGSPDYNQNLSERRAVAAKEYLVSQAGIDPVQIKPVGFGKSRLLPDKPVLAPEQRRIEFVVGTTP